MKRGPRWTPQEFARLRRLHVEGRNDWDEIAAHFPGRSPAACRQHFYYRMGLERGDSGRRRHAEQPAIDPAPPIAPPPKVARELARPVKRPRYFSDADAFVAARIAEQGITAGLLGDPPPGRSAFDKRGRA